MSTSSRENKPPRHLVTARLLQTAAMFAVIGGVLFVADGRLDWWEAWAFLIVYFFIALLTSVPLVLGSRWGAGIGALMIGMAITRTALRDEVLQKELPGYGKYSRQVHYRLFPGIW